MASVTSPMKTASPSLPTKSPAAASLASASNALTLPSPLTDALTRLTLLPGRFRIIHKYYAW